MSSIFITGSVLVLVLVLLFALSNIIGLLFEFLFDLSELNDGLNDCSCEPLNSGELLITEK